MKLIKNFIKTLMIVGAVSSAGFLGANTKLGVSTKYEPLDLTVVNSPKAQAFFAQTDKTKPQLTIFFSLGCGGCYHAHKALVAWLDKNQDKVQVNWVSLGGQKMWVALSRFYYSVEQLVTEPQALHKIISEAFNAVHVKHEKLWEEEVAKQFAVAHGLDGEAFSAIYNSFSMNTKLKRSDNLSQVFRITESPFLIMSDLRTLNEKHYFTNLVKNKTPMALAATLTELLKLTSGAAEVKQAEPVPAPVAEVKPDVAAVAEVKQGEPDAGTVAELKPDVAVVHPGE